MQNNKTAVTSEPAKQQELKYTYFLSLSPDKLQAERKKFWNELYNEYIKTPIDDQSDWTDEEICKAAEDYANQVSSDIWHKFDITSQTVLKINYLITLSVTDMLQIPVLDENNELQARLRFKIDLFVFTPFNSMRNAMNQASEFMKNYYPNSEWDFIETKKINII